MPKIGSRLLFKIVQVRPTRINAMETELIPGMSGVEESQFLSLLESQTTDLELEIAKLEFVVREKSVERGFEYEKKRYHRILKQNEEFHRTNKPLLSDFKLNVVEAASTSLIDTIKTFIADFGDTNEIGQAKRVREVIKRLREELDVESMVLNDKVKKKARLLNSEMDMRTMKWKRELNFKHFPLLTWVIENYHAMSHRLLRKLGPEVKVNENGKFYMARIFSQFITWSYHYEIRYRYNVSLTYKLDLDTELITILVEHDDNGVVITENKVTASPDEVMEYFNKFVDCVQKSMAITSEED